MNRAIDHLYILATIAFTAYSQLVMRWQVAASGTPPADFGGRLWHVLQLLVNPWVLSGVAATFAAGVSWMLAMTRFDISYAFPFVSLNYVVILLAGALLFHEAITPGKLLGSVLVIAGIVVIGRS